MQPTLFRNLQKGSLMCEERDIFPDTVHHYSLRWGFPYYGLMTPTFRMPRVPHSTTWGTQPSCSVCRAPWSMTRVLSALDSPLTLSVVLMRAYSCNTRDLHGANFFQIKQVVWWDETCFAPKTTRWSKFHTIFMRWLSHWTCSISIGRNLVCHSSNSLLAKQF